MSTIRYLIDLDSKLLWNLLPTEQIVFRHSISILYSLHEKQKSMYNSAKKLNISLNTYKNTLPSTIPIC